MKKNGNLLHAAIEEYLYRLINSREFKIGDKLPSERELAQKFNSSIIPVRQAMQKLTERGLLERAAGKGTFVRNVKTPDTLTNRVAVVHCLRNIDIFGSLFYGPIVRGLELEAAQLGKRLIFAGLNGGQDEKPQHTLYDLLPVVDGFILLGMAATVFDKIEKTIANLGKPVVVLNYENVSDRVDAVVFDGRQNGRKMTDFLLDLGHRRIACLCYHGVGQEFNYNKYQRVLGYQEALAARRIPLDPELLFGHFDNTDLPAFEKMVRRSPRPTAIFCADDELAIWICGIIRRLKIKIPRDLTVVGYDDIEEGQKLDPPLTTLHTPKEKMGQEGLRRLVAKQKEKDLGLTNVMKIVLPGEIMVRASHRSI